MQNTIIANIEFFAAALSQKVITAWQEDPAGVYCEVGRGIVEKYTETYVRIRNVDTGKKSHYARETTMFQTL
ncbi:hypothetical protein DCC85_08605 [Paenibacillus sp. CAA11]|uniref:hypothetical protein n=1 Tax=Paenibacillus sp. CAA11 TaxID=1532905 RepID=UPI000D337C8D|nr:hypothetical protein [Paenibacillus sp. CAA11]AWB44270.1 hypothetical protein DCC85_08605 [Paenibacillus sp. CAA11]